MICKEKISIETGGLKLETGGRRKNCFVERCRTSGFVILILIVIELRMNAMEVGETTKDAKDAKRAVWGCGEV